MKNRINWNIAIGVSGLILTVVAISVAYFGIRVSQNIAMNSGAFEKPEAVLLLGDEIIPQNKKQHIIYGFGFPENVVVFGRLPLILKNNGEKPLKNVSITIRYPNFVQIAVSNEYIKFDIQGPFFGNKNRKFDKLGGFDYVSIFFENINPGQSIHVGDIFSLNKTFIESEIEIPEINKKYSIGMFASIQLLVTTSSEGERPKDYPINISSIVARDVKELKEKYLSILSKIAYQTRQDSDFLDYLQLCIQNKREKSVLIFPKHTIIEVPDINNAKLYFPTSDQQDDSLIYVSYSLYSFSKLF